MSFGILLQHVDTGLSHKIKSNNLMCHQLSICKVICVTSLQVVSIAARHHIFLMNYVT